jgi:ribonuclease VapC
VLHIFRIRDRDRFQARSSRERELDDLCKNTSTKIVEVDQSQARIARHAYRDFGKGSGHPARLNFGDCFTYARAKALDEPLLYKGTDFSRTGAVCPGLI